MERPSAVAEIIATLDQTQSYRLRRQSFFQQQPEVVQRLLESSLSPVRNVDFAHALGIVGSVATEYHRGQFARKLGELVNKYSEMYFLNPLESALILGRVVEDNFVGDGPIYGVRKLPEYAVHPESFIAEVLRRDVSKGEYKELQAQFFRDGVVSS